MTVSWTAGAVGNPSYTLYEVERSTSSLFASPISTSFVVGLSSTPAGLSPNTIYYFRVRALNLDGVATSTVGFSTATLGSVPGTPIATAFITSMTFSWSAGANPSGTLYLAQISNNQSFVPVTASSTTAAASVTFAGLDPATTYYLRAAAINSAGARLQRHGHRQFRPVRDADGGEGEAGRHLPRDARGHGPDRSGGQDPPAQSVGARPARRPAARRDRPDSGRGRLQT